VAVVLLLGIVWCRAPVVDLPVENGGRALVGSAPGGTGTVPALRRHATGGLLTTAARADHGRALAAWGLLALAALTRLLPWGTLEAVRSTPSSLGRRRHIISLRAPPLATCV
jgi:hypothetical protein